MNARALTEFFVKRPIIFWSFVVGVLFMGVFSYNNMPKLEDPAVAVKQASVVLVYPGATAVKKPEQHWYLDGFHTVLSGLVHVNRPEIPLYFVICEYMRLKISCLEKHVLHQVYVITFKAKILEEVFNFVDSGIMRSCSLVISFF